MGTIRLITVWVCLAALPFAGFAQSVKVSSSLDKKTILIGQQFHMKVRVEQDAGLSVLWPEWNDTVTKGIEIVEIGKTDTVLSADKRQAVYTRDYLLTSFDSGSYTIPAFEFKAADKGTVLDKVFTDPLFLKVNRPAVDTTQDIKDIKGPVEIPFNWREFLPYILAAAGILLLAGTGIFFLLRYLRKRKALRSLVPEYVPPPVPAHEKALTALRELEQKQLWQQGKTKAHYTELTDILRLYIKDKFDIDAPEMLSDEIIQYLRFKPLTGEQKQSVRAVLELADMVKFAKAAPSEIENRESVNAVTRFVNETAATVAEDGKKEKGETDEH